MTKTKEDEKKDHIYHIGQVLQNMEPLDITKNHCLQKTKKSFGNKKIKQYKVINDGISVMQNTNDIHKSEGLEKGELITIYFN